MTAIGVVVNGSQAMRWIQLMICTRQQQQKQQAVAVAAVAVADMKPRTFTAAVKL